MATRTFRGTIDADWNTAGNWLELAVPLIADDVVFDATSPACTLSAAGNCLTLDCTGFAATITPGANTLTVAGTVFKLVAGCWVTGTCLLDFTATAGTVLFTAAGNTVYNLRFGNGGAGATFQLQDALAVANDLDIVRTPFQFNNQNATIARDLLIRSTVGAQGIVPGSGTLTITRNLDFNRSDPLAASTGKVLMNGTGQIIHRAGGSSSLSINELEAAFAGQTTGFNGLGGNGPVVLVNKITTYTGTLAFINTGLPSLKLTAVGTAAVSTPINMDAATVISPTGTITLKRTGSSGTVYTLLFPTVCGCGFNVDPFGGGTAFTFKLGRSTTLGLVTTTDNSGVISFLFDLNNFNLTCTEIRTGEAYQGGAAYLVNSSTLTVNGNAQFGRAQGGGKILLIGATGQVNVTGNFTLGRIGTSSGGIQMSTGALLTVGGNWISNLTGSPANAFSPGDPGTVNFNAAGAFTIASKGFDPWPTVRISGGGTVTLPANFNCYSLLVTNGVVTTAGDLTVRNSYNVSPGASMTVTANVFVGSSFINGGTVITTGSNIVTTGAACSIQGVNPATLTMSGITIRLQLLSAAVTIGSLIFQDRALPGVCQFKAAGTFTIGTLNSQIVRGDCPVQLISSTAGTKYTLTPTVVTSVANLWPRDCITTLAITGNLSNVNLGNNSGWTLNRNGTIRIITDDPGDAELAAAGFGLYEYCWLVSTTLVGLGTLVTNFAAGANNWHRRTSLPLAYLDNLAPTTLYYIALGLRDERDRRLAPVIGADDYATGYPALCGGGDGDNIVNTSCNTYGG